MNILPRLCVMSAKLSLFAMNSLVMRFCVEVLSIPCPRLSVNGLSVLRLLLVRLILLPVLSFPALRVFVSLDKARKEVIVCVGVDFPGEFLAVCFVALLVALVGVMCVVLPGCVEASGFEFYFDDVFPIGHAD